MSYIFDYKIFWLEIWIAKKTICSSSNFILMWRLKDLNLSYVKEKEVEFCFISSSLIYELHPGKRKVYRKKVKCVKSVLELVQSQQNTSLVNTWICYFSVLFPKGYTNLNFSLTSLFLAQTGWLCKKSTWTTISWQSSLRRIYSVVREKKYFELQYFL